MLRLFVEPEPNARAFEAITRFLDLLDELAPADGDAALDPLGALVPAQAALALGLPAARHDVRRVRRRRPRRLLAARGRRGVPRSTRPARSGSRRRGSPASSGCCRRRSPTRPTAGLSERARRDALAVVTSSYEEHGGFRLRTLSA